METYLIQRGTIKNKDKDEMGIDSHLSFDYMGASEYEWGALPASLRRIKEQKMVLTVAKIDNKDVWYLKPSKYTSFDVEEMLIQLSKNNIRLKCFIRFSKNFDQKETQNTFDENFWWDIENDIMFSLDSVFMQNLQSYVDNSMKKKS